MADPRPGPDGAARRATPHPAVSTGLLAVTLVLMAVNLRAAAASVGPVLREIQLDLGMSDTVAGVLTTLPVACFGVFGLMAGRLSRRVGTEPALVLALMFMTLGPAVRAFAPTTASLLVLSLPPLIGIAIGNVLAPVLVKAWFPSEVGRMTGWYSMAIALGTGLNAALTVPLADAFGGWRAGLGLWAIPAALALLPWLEIARRRRAGRAVVAAPREGAAEVPDVPVVVELPVDLPVGPTDGVTQVAVHRQLKAWALAVFFGLQTVEAYTAMGWLAAILRDAGFEPSRAGYYVAITMALGAPISLLLPRLAARTDDQRPWIVGLTAASAVAYIGLIVAPSALPLLWILVLGVGLGAFPLVLVLIGLRSTTPAGTAALSSLTQGVGYLLGTMGPVAIGILHDLTGAWTVPLLALIGLLVPKLIAGLIAAAPGAVDAPTDRSHDR